MDFNYLVEKLNYTMHFIRILFFEPRIINFQYLYLKCERKT